jgi:hypothetical protein
MPIKTSQMVGVVQVIASSVRPIRPFQAPIATLRKLPLLLAPPQGARRAEIGRGGHVSRVAGTGFRAPTRRDGAARNIGLRKVREMR